MTDCSDEPEPQPFGVLPSKRRHADAEQVDQEEVLDQLRVLEVRAWRERAGDADDVESERLGPAAEEFYEVFEVGADPDTITAGDADGVAIAAIQELADRLDDRNALIEQQARQLRRQQRRLDEQRADLETLREQLESLQAECSGAGGSEME
jgi:uncharacterized protein YukE